MITIKRSLISNMMNLPQTMRNSILEQDGMIQRSVLNYAETPKINCQRTFKLAKKLLRFLIWDVVQDLLESILQNTDIKRLLVLIAVKVCLMK